MINFGIFVVDLPIPDVNLLLVQMLFNHRNWSQADLAENASISMTFLSDIERGNKWPYPDTLANIACALDISIHELFIEDEAAVEKAIKQLMTRFVKDVSLTLNKSVRLSINQSLEHIKQQYSLDWQSGKNL